MRINTIRSTVGVGISPTVRAPIGLTTGLPQGLGQLARAGAEVAGVLTEIATRKKRVDDSVSLTKLEGDAKVSYGQHNEALKLYEDYETLDTFDQEGLARIAEQYNERASAINPDVSSAWKTTGLILNAGARVEGMPVKADRFKQNAISGAFTLMGNRTDLAVDAILAGDTEMASSIFNEVNDSVDFLRDEMGVSAVSAESWKNSFQNKVDAKVTLARSAIQREAREADAKAAKFKAEQWSINFGTMVVMESRGTLTEDYITGQIVQRKIDPMKGRGMIDRLRAEAQKGAVKINNPVVVGDLASDIESGLDVEGLGDRLDAALINEDIKTETYITLKSKMANREFRRGISYINRSLKPGFLDKWSSDTHIRHAEAIDDYQVMVAGGMDPVEAAREIVDRNIGDVRRSITGLRKPYLLEGDKTDGMALALARTLTVDKFKNGGLTLEEYKREIFLIDELEKLSIQLRSSESVEGDIVGRAERSRKLGRK